MLGSQPSLTEKMYFRISARKKIGIEIPISETTSVAWSNGRPCYLAARNPSGMPTPSAKIIATMRELERRREALPDLVVTERRVAMLVPEIARARVVFT